MDPKDRQVKHYYPEKKAVTLNMWSGEKYIVWFMMAERNHGI